MATCIASPFISKVHKALESGTPFDVVQSVSGYKVKPHSIGKRFFSSSKEQKESIGKIAEVLSDTLSKLPRMEIPEALNHPAVHTTRLFLKKVKKEFHSDPRIQNCWKQLIGTRLGVDAKLMTDEFLSFAREAHLERYLLEYNHKLIPNHVDFQIMCDGKYVDWKEVEKAVCSSPKSRRRPSQPWRYGPNGIQNEDMYEWKELRPYKHDDPNKWGNQYVFEYVVCATGNVRLEGDHAWFRLKTPTGDIYSVGLYRPGKRGSGDNFKFPFRVKSGYLMQPDVSEFWPDPRHSVQVKISKEQFETIKAKVEQDKKENILTYAMFNSNCSQYVNNIAHIAGVSFPTKMHVFRYITPKSILKVTDAIGRVLPRIIKKIIVIVLTPFLNLLLLILGAGSVDSSLKNRDIQVKPHISSFADIFRPSKHYFHPPLYFFNNVISDIKKWREEKIKKVKDLVGEQLQEKIMKISLSVPKKYRIVG